MKTVPLSQVVKQKKDIIRIDDSQEYKRVRIRIHRKGMVLRDIVKGLEIKTKSQQVCKEGQLLVAEIDAKVGGYGIVTKDLDGAIVSSHYYLFDIDNARLSQEYLGHILKTDMFFSQIKAEGSTNYASIRPKHILEIEIPLPSLEEQKKIVRKLDSYSSAKDKVESHNSENIELITKLRSSILSEAVQGKLVPQNPKDEPASELLKKIKKEKPLPPISEDEKPYALPKGWAWTRLPKIVTFDNGSIRRGPFGGSITKPMFVSKGYKIYEQKNAIYNNFKLGHYYIDENKFNEMKNFEIKPNDIIISCSGTIGKLAVVPFDAEKGIINQALLKLTLNQEIITNDFFKILFYAYIMSTNTLNDLKGTAMKNIVSIGILKKLPIPLPPLPEQHRIVEKVDKLMKLCDELEAKVKENQHNAEKLMEAVLKESFE